MKDLRISLYDLFGYLLPGLAFFAAAAVFFWAVFIPNKPLAWLQLSTEKWVVILLIGYFFGHMAHAIGNLCMKLFKSPEETFLSTNQSGSMPQSIIDAAKSRANKIIGVEVKDLTSECLFRICDESIAQYSSSPDRDIYQYREGFYRGLWVSFFLLSLSLVIRIWFSGTVLNIANAGGVRSIFFAFGFFVS